MKVTILSTSDTKGGAAIAALRVAQSLIGVGVEVKVLVFSKSSNSPHVIQLHQNNNSFYLLASKIQYAIENRFFHTKDYSFSSDSWIGNELWRHPAIVEADILHFHWINQGLMNYSSFSELFRLKKPIVWHLHDFWPFTGGCHYPDQCQNYLSICQNCPALVFNSSNDKAFYLWGLKHALYSKDQVTLVGASKWLAGEAKRSSLGEQCNVLHIPNPIDTTVYCPGDINNARKIFKLPEGGVNIFFAAMNTNDKRKGFKELISALTILASRTKKFYVTIAGKINKELISNLSFDTFCLGSLSSIEMISAYQAADFFVIPSLEENLPNTVMESMACGTPVVGFRTGGIPEMIDDGVNGLLAATGNVQELADCLFEVLSQNDKSVMRLAAREKVQSTFEMRKIGLAYSELFKFTLKK